MNVNFRERNGASDAEAIPEADATGKLFVARRPGAMARAFAFRIHRVWN